MFTPLLLPALIAGAPLNVAAADDPPIRIELNNDRFERGDRAKVRVETAEDGYLLVFHVDPDGVLRVLFPLDPGDDNFVRGDKRYELRGRGGRESFDVDVSSGRGFVYAAVSREPFRFAEFTLGDHWDYRVLAPRRLGSDPEPELTDLARRMATADFDYDILSYDVYEHVVYAGYTPTYWYPRIYDPWCDPYWGCGYPYYRPYGTSISIVFGRPFRRHFFFDPFFHDPFFRPVVFVPVHRPFHPFKFRRHRFFDSRRFIDRHFVDRRFVDRHFGVPYRDRRFDHPAFGGRRTFLARDRVVDRSRGYDFAAGGFVRTAEDGRRVTATPVSTGRRIETSTVGSDRTARRATERSEPRAVEPRRVGTSTAPARGREIEARRATPRDDGRGRPSAPIEVGRSRDRRDAEPRRVESRQVEPRRAEPRRVEPQRVEPRRVESRRAEPREAAPQARRAEPQRETRPQVDRAPAPSREAPSSRRVERSSRSAPSASYDRGGGGSRGGSRAASGGGSRGGSRAASGGGRGGGGGRRGAPR